MFLSTGSRFIYHVSIIDYLQDYNIDKKMERFFKTLLKGRNAEISAVPPRFYMNRFLKFMSENVIVQGHDKRGGTLNKANGGGSVSSSTAEMI